MRTDLEPWFYLTNSTHFHSELKNSNRLYADDQHIPNLSNDFARIILEVLSLDNHIIFLYEFNQVTIHFNFQIVTHEYTNHNKVSLFSLN